MPGASRPAEHILLFGSRARGDAREDSDLDLLVIESEVADRVAEMVRLRRVRRPLRIPADILVRSRDDVRVGAINPAAPCSGPYGREGPSMFERTLAEILLRINQLLDEETGGIQEARPQNAEPFSRMLLRPFDGNPRNQMQKRLR